eukprot:2234175-Pyramimonas_sp.AAC.1
MIVADIYASQPPAVTMGSNIRPRNTTVTTLLPDLMAAPTHGAPAPSSRGTIRSTSGNLRAQPEHHEAPRESMTATCH